MLWIASLGTFWNTVRIRNGKETILPVISYQLSHWIFIYFLLLGRFFSRGRAQGLVRAALYRCLPAVGQCHWEGADAKWANPSPLFHRYSSDCRGTGLGPVSGSKRLGDAGPSRCRWAMGAVPHWRESGAGGAGIFPLGHFEFLCAAACWETLSAADGRSAWAGRWLSTPVPYR